MLKLSITAVMAVIFPVSYAVGADCPNASIAAQSASDGCVRVICPLLSFRAGFDRYNVCQATAAWVDGVFKVTHTDSDPHACWIVPNNFAGQKPFGAVESVLVRTSPACKGYIVVTLRSERTGEEFRFNGDWGKEEVEINTSELNMLDDYTIAHVTFGFSNAASESVFAIKEIVGVRRQPIMDALTFDVDTGSPLRVLPNASQRATLVFGNPTDTAVAATGTVTAVDYFGKTLRREVNLNIEAGSFARIPMGPFMQLGIWRLCADLVAPDGSGVQRQARLLRLFPQPRTPRFQPGKFRIGVVSHLERHPDAERKWCLNLASILGMKIIRSDLFAMERIQPNSPDDWNIAFDMKVLGEIESYGMDVDAIIHRVPKWAAPAETCDKPWSIRAFGPAKPGCFESYCERLARQLGTRIAYYEIGNEWDLGPKGVLEVDEAVRMQAEAYRGIKRGCRDAVVCSNGFAAEGDNVQVQKKGFHEAFLNKAKGFFDVHAIHIHGGFGGYANAITEGFLPLRSRTGTEVPWFSNETATLPCFGAEDSAARAVWQKTLFAWAHGSRDYCWYSLESGSWREGGSDWGLYTADWMPRATAAAFASLTRIFSGLDFHKRIIGQNDRHIYAFRGNGRMVLAGWDSRVAEACDIPVKTDARKVIAVDLMGNTMQIKNSSGSVVFRLGATPSALVFPEDAEIDIDQDSLTAQPVQNIAAQIIPSGAASKRPPDFTVDTLDLVCSLFAANPLTKKRDWSGPQDLSAHAWLGLSKNSLQMLVDVTDDAHFQMESGSRIYLGDSVQIAFRCYDQDGGWLIGLSHGKAGPEVYIWEAPSGINITEVSQAAKLFTTREGTCTRYGLSLPLSTFGLSAEALRRSGMRFNFMVNDNDGEGRDGWVQCAPGIASNRDPSLYPLVRFQ